MQRLHPLCENFSQTIAHLHQSFAKLDSELDWLQTTSDNETSQKEREALFADLQAALAQNQLTIADLEGPQAARIVDELTTAHTDCDEFVQDLNDNLDLVKAKQIRTGQALQDFAEIFEQRKLKAKELFGDMDDLLEWLDDIEAKFTSLEAISHEPDVIRVQLTEQKTLNEEISNQSLKLKDLAEVSKSLVRNRSVEDSIELKEKLNSLQLQSGSLQKAGQVRLNELEQALAIAESFYESYRLIEAWFDEVRVAMAEVEAQRARESLASEAKEAVKAELEVVKQMDRGVQEKKSDFETMNKNGFALARLCNKNNGFLSLPNMVRNFQAFQFIARYFWAGKSVFV
jgi:hypothetical protein